MREIRSLLGIADFRRLWIAQLISDIGDSLTLFSLLFLVQRLTGDEGAVASVLIATALPTLVVGVFAGVWVDRWNLKKTMIGSDLVRAGLVLGLLLVEGGSGIWLLYGLVFLSAGVGTFFRPARQALLPRVVPGERLLAANSVSEATRVVGYAAGTAAAGLLVGLTGHFGIIFVIDTLTFLASALLVRMVTTEADPIPGDPAQIPNVRSELAEGIKTLLGSRWLLGVLVGSTLAMAGLGAVNGLIVPFVVGTLGLSETWFGLLEGAQSVGVLIAGSATAVLAARFRPATLIGVGLGAVGLSVAGFAVAQGVIGLTVLMLFVGVSVAPVQASAATIMQRETPPRLLGRAGSALSASATGSQVAALAIAGSLAGFVGVRTVFVLGGAVVLLAGLAANLLFRSAGTVSATPVPKAAAGT